mmetsp:Transcript_33372/g.103054  ORF Transcript_33372/g.103054 Transcript_33372/m.103054 type:complete len:281 (+) Transcript_33372:820-1662(+)
MSAIVAEKSRWRKSLEQQLRQNNASANQGLRQVFLLQQARGRIHSGECGRCHLVLSPRQISVLPCGHRRCQECLSRSLGDFLEPSPQPRDAASAARAESVRRARRCLHICEECLDLAVVVRQRCWFEPDVTECPVMVRPAVRGFVLAGNPIASNKLRAHVRVHQYFENERYSVLSGFAHNNLTVADVRGRFSDDKTDPVEPSTLDELPNSRWHFVDAWSVDPAFGDDGWRYALNWPGGLIPGAVWYTHMQWNSLVRQRRWRRTAVNFNDQLLSLFDRFNS